MTIKHITTITLVSIFSGAVLSLISCKNEADNTVDAIVSEAAPQASSQGGKKYTFTESSSIGFVGSKVTGSHEGGFKTFSGHFTLKDGEPQSGEFTIEINSIYSDDEKLTEHLKSPKFFNVKKHPQSKFAATAFTKKSDTNYELSGNLTLHGVTKNITFPAQVQQGAESIKITSEFDINRKDFEINYPGMQDDLIRDEVIIKLNLEAK